MGTPPPCDAAANNIELGRLRRAFGEAVACAAKDGHLDELEVDLAEEDRLHPLFSEGNPTQA